MYVRKHLDITWSDFFSGLVGCFLPGDEKALAARAARQFDRRGKSLVTLSVRSGLDLYLQVLDLPGGCEVLVGAINIPHMFEIIREHGLVPIPVDLQVDTLGPSLEALEAARTEKTRAVLVPHLFGGRMDVGPLVRFSHKNNLLFLEDCAQAFDGHYFRGHPESDVSFFSFGTIKFVSAMGGSLVRVQDPKVLAAMAHAQDQWPRQKSMGYFWKLKKYSVMKWISQPRVIGFIAFALSLLGRDYDTWANALARGFPGDTWLKKIRHRPCVPLLALLNRRLRQNHQQNFAARRQVVAQMTKALKDRWVLPGRANKPDHGWLFALEHREPAALARALGKAGFDATQGQSLVCCDAPEGRPDPQRARALLQDHVLLPVYPELPEIQRKKMIDFLLSWSP